MTPCVAAKNKPGIFGTECNHHFWWALFLPMYYLVMGFKLTNFDGWMDFSRHLLNSLGF
jgi:hypothetical protein